MGRLFIEGRPRFTMNSIVLVLSVFQAAGLFVTGCSFEGVCRFFRTGLPEPSVCGPLFMAWVIVLLLYWTKIVKSPKLSTVAAAVFVYFGTATLLTFRLGDAGGNVPVFLWATSVHAMEACIGYGYFVESVVRKYKLW